MNLLQSVDGKVSNIAVFIDDADIPEGWQIAPDGVAINHIDNGDGTFSQPVAPAKSAEVIEQERIDDIDAEIKTRIITLFGANHSNWIEKEMNALMRAAVLNNIETKTTVEQTEADALVAIANQVEAIRSVGNTAQVDGTLLADIAWP